MFISKAANYSLRFAIILTLLSHAQNYLDLLLGNVQYGHFTNYTFHTNDQLKINASHHKSTFGTENPISNHRTLIKYHLVVGFVGKIMDYSSIFHNSGICLTYN